MCPLGERSKRAGDPRGHTGGPRASGSRSVPIGPWAPPGEPPRAPRGPPEEPRVLLALGVNEPAPSNPFLRQTSSESESELSLACWEDVCEEGAAAGSTRRAAAEHCRESWLPQGKLQGVRPTRPGGLRARKTVFISRVFPSQKSSVCLFVCQ